MNKSLLLFIKNILPVMLAIIAINGCGSSSSQKKNLPVKRDTTITKTNAYSSLELDSMMIENYISNNQ